MSSRTQPEETPMQTPAVESSVEHTSIGRIVVPPNVPRGFRLFYTTIDFDGRLDDRIRNFVKPAALSSCHQVHGANVCKAPVNESECDALWTDQKNTALAIKVADCLPVSIIDPQSSVIANIHSGWRGAVQNIVAKTLSAIRFEPSESFAFLGPSIRVCCFEVGEEVAAQFEDRFVDRSLGAKPHVDIAAFTTSVLRDRGVRTIVDTGLCTRCGDGVSRLRGYEVSRSSTPRPRNPETSQPLFHSYRRDRKSGRNLAIVAS